MALRRPGAKGSTRGLIAFALTLLRISLTTYAGFIDGTEGVPSVKILCETAEEQGRVLLEWKESLPRVEAGSTLESWTSPASTACNNWAGVGCVNDVVVELRLSESGLSGTIPRSLSCFSSTLQQLDLSSNAFTGGLPPQFSALVALSLLNVSSSSLDSSAALPKELSTLTALQDLDLSGSTRLAGALPLEWSALRALRTLDLSSTGVNGQLPSAWSALQQLRSLRMLDTAVTGTLPSSSWLASDGMAQLRELSIGGKLSGPVDFSRNGAPHLRVLDLAGNGALNGSIPSELNLHPTLSHLDLSRNLFTGSLPASLLSSPTLRLLDLSSNNLSGALIPDDDSDFVIANNNNVVVSTLLATLSLGNNPLLTGPLPVSFSALMALESLNLAGNNHSGPLPEVWTNLRALRSLSLSRQPHLRGPLPPAWSAMTGLQELEAQRCALSGLPPSWSTLTALRGLSLSGNPLDTRLPDSWSAMSSIVELCVGVAGLTGTLPSSWSILGDTLVKLDVRSNRLTGTLPNSWAETFARVEELYFHRNRLTGSLPVSFAEMPSLGKLSLRSNRFSGTISPDWARSRSLFKWVVSDNRLEGSIPSELGDMNPSGMKVVWLGEQSLTGTIPTSLCQWSRMEMLHIHSAQLTGTIPACIANLTYANDIALSDNRLSGSLPSAIGDLAALHTLLVSGNHLTGAVPSSLTRLSSLSALSLCSNTDQTDICFTCPDADPLDTNPKCGCPTQSHTNDFTCAPPLPSSLPDVDLSCVVEQRSDCSTVGDDVQESSTDNTSLILGIAVASATGMSAMLAAAVFACLRRRRYARDEEHLATGLRNNKGSLDKRSLATASRSISASNSAESGSIQPSSGVLKYATRNLPSLSVEQSTSSSSYNKIGSGTEQTPSLHRVHVLELLGTGASGRVYRGTWKGVTVAQKIMNLPANPEKCEKLQQAVAMETTISASLRHPNVVQTFSYELVPVTTTSSSNNNTDDDNTDKDDATRTGDVMMWEARIVQEYCSGGSLRNALSSGTLAGQMGPHSCPATEVSLTIARDIAAGMYHIHTCNVIHGDLKCCNILLQSVLRDGAASMLAKVADFGLSTQLSEDQSHVSGVQKGTLTHMAPELLTTGVNTKAADVYAFGVVLYELFSGKRPWTGKRAATILQDVVQQGARPSFPPNTPKSVVVLASSCWQAKPERRPDFQTVVQTLTQMMAELRNSNNGNETAAVEGRRETPELGMQCLEMGGTCVSERTHPSRGSSKSGSDFAEGGACVRDLQMAGDSAYCNNPLARVSRESRRSAASRGPSFGKVVSEGGSPAELSSTDVAESYIPEEEEGSGDESESDGEDWEAATSPTKTVLLTQRMLQDWAAEPTTEELPSSEH